MARVQAKYRVERGVALVVLCSLSFFITCSAAEGQPYEIPAPKVTLLKPRGFQVSIPDTHGIQLFAFHGNLNKKMEKMAAGQFAMDIIAKQNGKWVYQNRKLKVRAGDVIYFWTFVIKDGKGYTRDNDIYEVAESDVNRTQKKVHKLRKRHAHRPYIIGSYAYGPGFPTHQYHGGVAADGYDKTLGYGYGHGMPHHQERGHPHRGHGYAHGFGHGHGHGHDFTGVHTAQYHEMREPHHPHDADGYRPYHFQHFHGHTFDHNDHFHGHGHGHGYGRKPGYDSDCSGASKEDDTNNDEANTGAFPSAETTDAGTVDTITSAVVAARTTTAEPEPEADVLNTTSPLPQIDIRFGAKTK